MNPATPVMPDGAAPGNARRGRTLAGAARLALAALLVASAPAQGKTTSIAITPAAQTAPAPAVPEDITPQQVAPLLANLTDAQARQLLARELAERAARNAAPADPAHSGFGVVLVHFRQRVEAFARGVRGQLATLASGAAQLGAVLPPAVSGLAGAGGFGRALLDLALVLGLAVAARAGARRALAPHRARLEGAAADGIGRRVAFALGRAALDLAALAAFALAALAMVTLLSDGDAARESLVIAFASATLVVLTAAIPARLLLAPSAPGLRLLPLDDDRARFAHRWTMTFVAAGTFAWLTAGLVILTGVPMAVHLVIVALTGALMAALGVAAILRWGRRFRPAGGTPWPALTAGYVAVVYLLWLQEILTRGANAVWSAIGSLLAVAALPLLYRLVDRQLEALQIPARAPAPAAAPAVLDEADAATVERIAKADHEHAQAVDRRAHYLAVLRSGVHAALALAVVLVVLELWGIHLAGGMVGRAALLQAGLVVLIAVGLWMAFRALVKPYMPVPGAHPAGDEDGTIPRTRTETLLPLTQTTVAVLLVVFTTTIVLSTIGVNVAPLLAGAGVIGLAIGFGAQTLVRDIVAGIFFLIDDAFRVGEYIEFDKLRGEVEGITLRSLKLRHHRGAIHTVPFGELRSVTNYSRDWVIYKMEFRLHADTDVERVRKLVKNLGQELLQDPEFGQDFLQPLKSQGIAAVDENAIILRCKFMSKPRKQFVLRRHCYHRLKQLFKDEGIEFAPRTVRVASMDGAHKAGEPPETAGAAVVAEQGQA